MDKNEYITRVEGHGNLKIDFDKNKAQIIVEESERLFEQLVVNYPYTRAPFITARICGICPTAHYLASIKAIEEAFDVEIPQGAEKLRKILLAGQIIQSHTLHLFFLTLPDYTNSSSVKEFSRKNTAEFHLGMNLKKTADKIVNLLGGREVHPLTPKVGGFKKTPGLDGIKEIGRKIDEVLDEAEDTVKLFDELDHPSLNQEDREYLNISSESYPYYSGNKIETFGHDSFNTQEYDKYIKEEERRGTLVKFSRLDTEKENNLLFMLGALARINNRHEDLNNSAKKSLIQSSFTPPSFNPFDNIPAQAVEILHFLEEARNIINEISHKDLKDIYKKPSPKKSEGVGCVEAPRGTLYHYYRFNNKGEIIKADIITPTAQNMFGLEKDADRLIDLYKNESRAKKEKLTEELIRAYDPCLTCSVH